ncbi:MAG: N-acetylglutaminylglutamine synthetase [Magnetococcales bacterium]|nr:N-acetylglutaminylglutamine synthetase [Magnetococcales bacterium]
MSRSKLPDKMNPQKMASLKHWGELPEYANIDQMLENVVVDCGWGQLIFGQTFKDPQELVQLLQHEQEGKRDLALYVRDPHVLISFAPQELFLDPSYTYRLIFSKKTFKRPDASGFSVSLIRTVEEGIEANAIFAQHNMIRVSRNFYSDTLDSKVVHVLVAKDDKTGAVLGVATGIDHRKAFNDPDNGSSLWSVAVDNQCPYPGVGERIVLEMARMFQKKGRDFLDLSVFYDNVQAISLYEKLGFEKIPVYCLKHKNCINEKLFSGPRIDENFNVYARVIVDEARRRGIVVDVLDAENGFFNLTFGGRSVTCRESLCELTSAIAMTLCQDKFLTQKRFRESGLSVPDQITAADRQAVIDFLHRYKRLVVKPSVGEQGQDVRVDLCSESEVFEAIGKISGPGENILVEQLVEGTDLRIIVIDFKVVAAAVRNPPQVTGDGQNTIQRLIEKLSRRRAAATEGESHIPLDDETVRCVRQSGYEMDTVLPLGLVLPVRKTANLHTGGVIQDVTPLLHPQLSQAAVEAAQALNIPVVGLDFMVPDVEGEEYYIIEANERPGLANHEPQPTVERFVDLMFPQTRPAGLTCSEFVL